MYLTDVKDPEIKKIVRDMEVDERDVFMSIYSDLAQKAKESALRLTPIRLAKQRKEQAQKARERLIEVNQELQQLSQTFAAWRIQNPDAIMPEEMGKNRSQTQKLLLECEKLNSVIQLGG